MPVIRFILITFIVYLLVRSFMRHSINDAQNNNHENGGDKIKFETKKISKSIGEYIDYEEVDKEDSKGK